MVATGAPSVSHLICRRVWVTRAMTDTTGDVLAVGSRTFTATMSPAAACDHSGHAAG